MLLEDGRFFEGSDECFAIVIQKGRTEIFQLFLSNKNTTKNFELRSCDSKESIEIVKYLFKNEKEFQPTRYDFRIIFRSPHLDLELLRIILEHPNFQDLKGKRKDK